MIATLPSWLLPAAATVAVWVWASRKVDSYRAIGDYDFGRAILAIFCFSAATIVTLLAWLVWALAR
jgi:hypothetical protein